MRAPPEVIRIPYPHATPVLTKKQWAKRREARRRREARQRAEIGYEKDPLDRAAHGHAPSASSASDVVVKRELGHSRAGLPL